MRAVLAGIAAVALAASAVSAAGPPYRCEPTSTDQLGPYYVPNAPVRAKTGTGLVVRGVVRSAETCRPVASARIEVWHAGAEGRYAARYRATLFSGKEGSYRYESVYPGRYGGRPVHVHIRVSAGGYETLVTQYYPDGKRRGTFDLVLAPAG